MTRVTKTVTRVTDTTIREKGKTREIVVHIDPRRIGFRAKGCKTTYWLTADYCYNQAVKAEVAAKKKAKAKEKRSKKRDNHRKSRTRR